MVGVADVTYIKAESSMGGLHSYGNRRSHSWHGQSRKTAMPLEKIYIGSKFTYIRFEANLIIFMCFTANNEQNVEI